MSLGTEGILSALALFLILQPAVIYFHFAPWLKDPNRLSPVSELYFHASIHSFMAMAATGFVLTRFFSGISMDRNPIIDFYGYNNLCIVFDTPPSTYIMPVFWFFTAYLMVRYAVEDTKRLMQLTGIGPIGKAISYGVNIVFVLAAAFFSLCLAIDPARNMLLHTLPFVALILAFPLVFVMHCWQCEDRSYFYVGAVVFFTVLSFVYAAEIIIALAFTHLPVILVQPIDYLWTICAIAAPLLMRAPKMPGKAQSAAP